MKKFITHLTEQKDSEHPALHGFRALAIGLVVICHYFYIVVRSDADFYKSIPASLVTFFQNTSSGIDAFFVLSGFLISAGLMDVWKKKGRVDLGEFFIKRTMRIFPGYYLFIGITFLISLAQVAAMQKIVSSGVDPDGSVTISLAHYKAGLERAWGDFLFMGNYVRSLHYHTWSLSVEEQFYVVMPFICGFFLFLRSSKFAFRILVLLYFVPGFLRTLYFLNIQDPFVSDRIYYSTETRFDAFIVGIAVMYLTKEPGFFVEKLKHSRLLSSGLSFLAIFLLILAHCMEKTGTSLASNTIKFNFLNIGFGLLVLVFVSGAPTFLGKLFSAKIWIPVARLSYTMYLWHIVLLTIANITDPNAGFGFQGYLKHGIGLAVFFGALLAFTFCVYGIVDYPLQKVRDRILKSYKLRKELQTS
ncbi:acyltransferase [Leptospira gomenensis]|uniref:Acyltransferase n=1 Tax=Leptospira gomenensis TaxID=2484974 RepID=A0A5F1YRT7_9LEPT|nr:acyltransferase [Leptospira gomenensis]TGK30881.1 acyltransferase [Leptospira gomenensis]TGK32519.1 acyltransferase [Leptospira gomenensis]TGK45399.1 acyltransferase [Leptospira gomenensis]TGK60609.1 acyltransferase [Leptospira gomenensis]